MISDHALVAFSVGLTRPVTEVRWTTSRAWRRLDRDAFASDLANSALCCNLDVFNEPSTTADDLATLYDEILTGLLDQHCPVVKVRRRQKDATPWFDAECRQARRLTRRAERRYMLRRSDAHRLTWAEKAAAMKSVYEAKSSSFWREEIASSKGDSRRLWRTFHGVLGEVPNDASSGHTADDFAEFFQQKVDAVRASCATTPLYNVPWTATTSFNEWTPVTTAEVDKLVGAAPNKSCQLDPAPTWLVKDMRGLLVPFFVLLFNKSLTTGCFPSTFKHAVVHPLLKKSGLNSDEMKNYRPVSNLSFLSKLLERVVQNRLQSFLDSHDLMPTLQSAYRQNHSTETAVTKVYSDLLMTADCGQISALCLLDLTAAFDTVDHELALHRLERQFGLRGVVLEWFRSYLHGRTVQVVHDGDSSRVIRVVCSFPQGSVLGPRLFVLYTAELEDIADAHDVTFHAFADDTQWYVHCNRDDTSSAIDRLQQCVADVDQWMAANRLKLNADKTELIWTGSKRNLAAIGGSGPVMQLGTVTIAPTDHVRVLGVSISSDLSLERHVASICSTSFFHLRRLRRVRNSLDNDSASTLVHAFVTSRIDYCNAVFAGSAKSITDKLQRVLNAAARVVSNTRKFDRGLSSLKHTELHWLDVPAVMATLR